jgi:hypothetical protein
MPNTAHGHPLQPGLEGIKQAALEVKLDLTALLDRCDSEADRELIEFIQQLNGLIERGIAVYEGSKTALLGINGYAVEIVSICNGFQALRSPMVNDNSCAFAKIHLSFWTTLKELESPPSLADFPFFFSSLINAALMIFAPDLPRDDKLLKAISELKIESIQTQISYYELQKRFAALDIQTVLSSINACQSYLDSLWPENDRPGSPTPSENDTDPEFAQFTSKK